MAEAAGATGCVDSCPLPDAEIMCTREYAPVICNGCTYSNACSGTAAGFAESDCSAVCPDSATPVEGVACTLEYAPVFCQGCEFANECVATSLGFDVATDCASIATRQTTATDEPTGDPTPDTTPAPPTSPGSSPTSTTGSGPEPTPGSGATPTVESTPSAASGTTQIVTSMVAVFLFGTLLI